MSEQSTSPSAGVNRRHLIAAAGTAGAVAAAVTALPLATSQDVVGTAAAPQDAPATGGYQETAHILRYYQTARV